jgi:hypothetical protein
MSPGRAGLRRPDGCLAVALELGGAQVVGVEAADDFQLGGGGMRRLAQVSAFSSGKPVFS